MTDTSSMFYCSVLEYDSGPRGILDCCSLCTKSLLKGRDIFMYQGDTPFCSEECRQEQIDIDQEKEFRRNYANRRSVSSTSSVKHGRELKQRQEEISC